MAFLFVLRFILGLGFLEFAGKHLAGKHLAGKHLAGKHLAGKHLVYQSPELDEEDRSYMYSV